VPEQPGTIHARRKPSTAGLRCGGILGLRAYARPRPLGQGRQTFEVAISGPFIAPPLRKIEAQRRQ
jgi:hypothetical protein